MNFLAHLYLSAKREDIIVGNFIADHVKGSSINDYSPEVQKGIRLHRAIDTFTDNHPIVKRSVERVREQQGKFSGVVVDMYYDHFLSSNWSKYSNEKLEDFTRYHYKMLMKNFLKLPSRTKRLLPFMIKDNWLESYRELKFLQWSFNGLSSRTNFNSNMQNAVNNLEKEYDSYKEDFFEFFPELVLFSEEELNRLDQI